MCVVQLGQPPLLTCFKCSSITNTCRKKRPDSVTTMPLLLLQIHTRKAKPNTNARTKPNTNTNKKLRETAGEKSGIVVILILVPLMQLMKEDSVWLMERLQTSR